MTEIRLCDVLKRITNSDRIVIRQKKDKSVLYEGYCANVEYADFNIDEFVVENICIGTNVQKRQKYHWGVPVLEDRRLDKPVTHYTIGELDFDAFLRIDVKNASEIEHSKEGGDEDGD